MNLFCCCKKERREEANIEIIQKNRAELDGMQMQEGERLAVSISQKLADILKLKEMADQGDINAKRHLPTIEENIKFINNKLNIK